MKISEQDSSLQGKQAQVQQLKESAEKATDPSVLEEAKAEAGELKDKETKEKGKMTENAADDARKTQEINSLEEKTKALETRKQRIQSVEKSEKDEQANLNEAAQHEAKK
jgi:Tfp pilus assembly protein PilN